MTEKSAAEERIRRMAPTKKETHKSATKKKTIKKIKACYQAALYRILKMIFLWNEMIFIGAFYNSCKCSEIIQRVNIETLTLLLDSEFQNYSVV